MKIAAGIDDDGEVDVGDAGYDDAGLNVMIVVLEEKMHYQVMTMQYFY